jgi:hypothetical protein
MSPDRMKREKQPLHSGRSPWGEAICYSELGRVDRAVATKALSQRYGLG